MRTSTRTGPPFRRTVLAGLAVLGVTALSLLGIPAPAGATTPVAAAPAAATSGHQLFEPSCATPGKGEFTCYALRRTDLKPVRGVTPAAVSPTGWGIAAAATGRRRGTGACGRLSSWG
ncbi:hypothetical protein V2S66_10765 [Streptomyces sp. V4-01]|uniref:Uncharacterized protein n=1 Tax=Actinacidiphila polyblastidii TaxID=3110430 RepID=A0ABU7PB01_9ACTN|nr:hypothetical protein [Streptomyces sp. V4-01]